MSRPATLKSGEATVARRVLYVKQHRTHMRAQQMGRASQLGIARSALCEKIRKYNLLEAFSQMRGAQPSVE
jgi:hypothetical protein